MPPAPTIAPSPDAPSWFDVKASLLDLIEAKGGWVNAHAHIDRAYSLTTDTFRLADAPLDVKWDLLDEYRRAATVGEIYDRMAYAMDVLCAQGLQAIGSFIDVDPVVKDKAIKAAERLRHSFSTDIHIRFINQVLKGVLHKEARAWFELGAEFADIVGALPERDSGHEAEHLDIVLDTAARLGKMVHVHVDQARSPHQRHTAVLAEKTVEYALQNRVVAIHCVSVAAQPQDYRQLIYAKLKTADIMVVACPLAWLDSKRNETLAPLHNAITPVDELIEAGIVVAMGTDNIADVYKPFSEGDLWAELRTLLEAVRLHDLDALSDIATINGLKVLGLRPRQPNSSAV